MRRGRKKLENPETARRILVAAERAFASQGMAGARTEEIARSAGVNKAMLYYYFGSKKKLHRAVFENLFSQANRLVEAQMPRDATPQQAILAFVDGYFRFRTAYPNYARLMQQMMIESPEQVRWIARNYFRPGYLRLGQVIQEGVANGEFRPVDAGHTVINLIAMMVFYFSGAAVHSVLLGREALKPSAVAAHKRAVLELLQHGLFRNSARSR